ncbi:translocation/assembly module TamB [Chitinophagaceae bacterium LB-8]|uniref:Translocation/assembly module TamB n=1 Tax=Paraflavisolibacter caeni TaxID=2982496 RepID=A0A9X3B9G1_9BACT|nr:translocation/assembly module TamB domain-containing protein [Paraflavisolibacter caeni]MCU7551930.1 translocation/assembly module TamB [Paraflavisolibacter caeni]
MLLIAVTWGLLHTDWGQNWLSKQVTKRLSRNLQTKISIDHVEVGFFNRLNLGGVLLEDRKKDTLLYAGTVQVRITDWFFLKTKAELKYIGLEDALIKLQRKDSIWNYSFLADYFASPGTSTPKKKAGIEFNLKEIILRNVTFIQKDAWLGRDMIVKTGSMNLDANNLSISKRILDISKIELVRPYFHINDYTGNRPKRLKRKFPKKITNDSLQWNVDNWTMLVNNISLENGTFRNDRNGLTSTVNHFDGEHINFSKITGSIKNLRWIADTIKADIDISSKERSGLVVHRLKTAYRFHPQLMEFSKLYIKTNRSVLTDYYAMRFNSLDSMNNFLHAVELEGHFKNSIIHSDDIAYFAPQIKDWNRTIQVSGRAKGSVDDLSGQNMRVKMGNNTFISGDISIVGLPSINSSFINIKADELRTTYADAVNLVPAIRTITTPNLRQLQFLRFTGTYTGFLRDFVMYGNIQTALGTLETDLNMKFPGNKPPVYSGSLATRGFHLGRFINSPQLGTFAFDGDLKGRGFDWKTLDLNVDGTVHKIQYNKYTYQNITAKGRISKQVLDGNFTVKDPNADLHLTGIIDLSKKQPIFNAHANIAYANLLPLQISKEDLVLKGIFDLNFSGNNLSDFTGNARISNGTLLHNGKQLLFDSLVVATDYKNGVKTLRANSNEFSGTVTGNFDINTLPDAFMLFLNRYYPSYIKAPRRQLPKQAFTFEITTGIIEDYIKLADKRLSGFNNSYISGSLNLDSNSMTINANVPQFAYEKYEFSNIELNGNGNLDRLVLSGQVNNAIVSDSLNFPHTTFSIQARNDISDVTLNTTANQTINEASLSTQVQTFSDGFKLLFNPSSFVINGKTWTVDQGGELNFRKNTVVHGEVALRETNQEIHLTTRPSDIGNWNDLFVNLQNINLGDISPLLVKTNRIEGLLSGEIQVEDPQNRFNVNSNIRAEELRVDNDSIGQVVASVEYNNNTGLLTGKGNNVDEDHKVSFDLALDLKDSANFHRDRISVRAETYPAKILERFIGTLFSDLQGYITGNLDILGEGASRDYVGKAAIKDASLKVNFTQVNYKIDDAVIDLKENEIDFGTLKLRDRNGNTATVRGKIKHKGFRDMDFDIQAKVDARPMELLNTTYNDNQAFYGKAYGTGEFVLVGPQNDILMNIDAVASQTDSSFITLPPSSSRESGTANFMVERKYGREMTGEDFRGAATNITYVVNLTANPMVNVQVILDELTGDIIRGNGSGNLRISSGSNEPLSLRGRYEIQKGNYLFTFQSFFKKPFELRPGGNNYIEWNGDPYDATIHFDAVYKAENVSFAPLTGGTGLLEAKDFSNVRSDVNVLATLTGELFRPTFDFKLEFPDQSLLNKDHTLPYAIQQIERNTNELNKQVTYLIVFNSFAPYGESSGGLSKQFSELAYSTISGLFFGEVNKRLNQLLGRILQNNDLTVNFTGSVYNRNLVDQSARGFNINQTNFNISVGRAFFENRFVLTFGSTFDVPLQSDLAQNIQFLPDVTAEWLINKSGSIRATFFYRQNLDFFMPGGSSQATGSRTTRTGAGIAYRKEFDSISKILFGRKKGTRKISSLDSAITP